MIKLGVFQVSAIAHGYTLAVEKSVEKTEKKTVDGVLTFVGTGEYKTVVEKLGFFPKADQLVNRIAQHELSRTQKTGGDLGLFIKTINDLTNAINNI